MNVVVTTCVAEVTTCDVEVTIVRSDVTIARFDVEERRDAAEKAAAVGVPAHPEVADRPVRSARAEMIVAQQVKTKVAAGVHAQLRKKSAPLPPAKSVFQGGLKKLPPKLRAGKPSASVYEKLSIFNFLPI